MTTFDLIIIGTGFGASFYLYKYLQHAGPDARVLVLERGSVHDTAWQVAERRNSEIDYNSAFVKQGLPEKSWRFNIGFGGGSNCWWACTPRMMPNDFRLNSRYGVGRDWPVSYDELEAYYQEAEEIMAISGSDHGAPFPRSKPYPQPPHRFSDPDRLLKAAFPDAWFPQPTARARVATTSRPACCANSICDLCPISAKFTIANGLGDMYRDHRVTLLLQAEALAIETAGGTASGVVYHKDGAERAAQGDLIVLAANAMFNPFILTRSGLDHPLLGRRLHEQVSIDVTVYFDGVDSGQGSTTITGHGYMLYDGPHRARHGACLIEGWNRPIFRNEPGRWRQIQRLKCIVEDLPQERNRVAVSSDHPAKPEVRFEARSDYALRGIAALDDALPKLLASLPVERLEIGRTLRDTEAHIQGTTVMGDDPTDSVIDRNLVHHQVRNLLVMGSGAFPTGAPANPTLTISALALRAADHQHGHGGRPA
jgi:choline dehydrogenase-like flavoprotein